MTSRIALASVLLLSGVAAANPDWTVSLSGTVNTSSSTNNSSIGLIHFTNNSSVYAVNDLGVSMGRYDTGGTVEDFPIAVPLAASDNQWYLFIASDDGYLYKINAQTMQIGIVNGHPQMVNFKRASASSCVVKDQLKATPAVQLAAYSRSDWTYSKPVCSPSSGCKDVVYVITRHGCGETASNQVIALDAGADMTVYNPDTGTGALWTFNQGERFMDYGAQGCSIDYSRNQLYCGTNSGAAMNQPTVWALYTGNDNTKGATAHTAGNQAWAAATVDTPPNSTSVQTRPQLGLAPPELLYVADFAGVLHAFDPDVGTERWAINVSVTPTNVTQNIWAEFRNGFDHLIFVTDTSGVMHMVSDGWTGSAGTGSVVWNKAFGGLKAMSIASLVPPAGKLYIGLNDGSLHQLNLSTRSDEANVVVGGSTDVVMDPTFDIQGVGATNVNKVIAISNGPGGGTVKQFSVPLP